MRENLSAPLSPETANANTFRPSGIPPGAGPARARQQIVPARGPRARGPSGFGWRVAPALGRVVGIACVCASTVWAQQRPSKEFSPPSDVEWIKNVEYAKGGGRAIRLDILRPAKASAAKMPALIYIHGGAFKMGSKEESLNESVRHAQRGYFTVTIDYRLAGEAIFPAAIEDCKAAVRWLRANADTYGIDSTKIGVWGHSAGGHLSSLLGTSQGVKELEGSGGNAAYSSDVTCVVDCYGPSDFTTLAEMRGKAGQRQIEEEFIGGPLDEKVDAARQASPITHVSKDDPPFLILHGTDDPAVPFKQSKTFYQALRDAGVEATFVSVKNGGHGWLPNKDVDARIDAFFDRHLLGKDVEVSADSIKGEPPPRPQSGGPGGMRRDSGPPPGGRPPPRPYDRRW